MEQIRLLPWVPPMFRPLERNMLDLDPPDHTRLRALVHKASTPSLVEQAEALSERGAERVRRVFPQWTLSHEALSGSPAF